MKQFFCIVLSTVISTFAFAQGITKNGKITTDGTTYINKNGAVGLSTGVDKNGKSVLASPLPTVTTTASSAVTDTQATTGGNVTANGTSNVTARGITWSLTASPNITGQGTVITDGATTGTGVGSFTNTITGLAYSTNYYVRAFATNSSGTSYGSQVSFTTAGPPIAQSGGNAICDYSHYTTVVDVTLPNGKVWMDRNLGASRAATSLTDYEAYGCLYQWGRGNDGHANMNWTNSTTGTLVNGFTNTLSTTDSPGHANFIYNSGDDWRSPQNDLLWQGVAGINNPCPTGYRIPTIAELEEITAGTSSAAAAAAMKFTKSGTYIGHYDNVGTLGIYHSSSVDGTDTKDRMVIVPSGFTQSQSRQTGASVRCIKKLLAVGDDYQGGKVAYLLVSGDTGYDANVQHGLIAATEDQTVVSEGIRWNNGTDLSVFTGAAIGTGSANTDAIIAAQGAVATSYAAGLARAYTGGGYTDWYLPSINELSKLYLSKAENGFSNDVYWSSSEKNGTSSLFVWILNFIDGSTNNGFSKGGKLYVRAVRSF